MGTQRKTGGREELDALWAQVEAILADYTSGLTGTVAAIRRVNTALLDRQKLGAIIVDLGVLRTPVVALITDYTAGRAEVVKLVTDITSLLARFNAGLVARAPHAALIADVTAVRTKLLTAGADLAALRSPLMAALRRVNTQPLARSPLAAIVTDLTDLRTKLAAAVVDLGNYRTQHGNTVTDLTALIQRANLGATTSADIAAGTTNGKIKSQRDVHYKAFGISYAKVATDDLFDLSGLLPNVAADRHRAVWLLLDYAGTATVSQGTDALDEDAALAALPALGGALAPIGVFLAGHNCNFANALGGQGDFINGWPNGITGLASQPAITATAPATLSTTANLGLADGAAAGKIKTRADQEYIIGGRIYTKAATDNLWDLSAEVDTDATHYRAYWLYLDSAGTATFVAGADTETSEDLAIAALPAEVSTKCPIGVYVAGPSTDFDNILGLDNYGTYYDGRPTAAADPAALTYADPAAISATANLGIANGGTDGFLKTQADSEFAIAGSHYRKAAADDVWDLHSEVDTDGTHYRAYWLYVNAAGTASFAAGTDETSAEAAVAALPTLDAAKAVLGVYAAGPSTDFNGVAGLAAQGTLYDGYPAALAKTASAPAAVTAATPAAISTDTTLAIGNGGTAGRLRTNADLEYMISGVVYRKAATDNLWNLAGETDTTGAQYRAYWLYLDAGGNASFAAGTNAASGAGAIAALPAETSTKCPVGCFVASPSCDFDAGGGLAAQGTLYDGRPVAASDPSAITATSTTLIHA